MDWREMAACLGRDPDLFFPVGNSNSGATLMQITEAKAVCRRCPVVEQCLNWAVKAVSVDGIWGGTTEVERRAMRKRMVRRSQNNAANAARSLQRPSDGLDSAKHHVPQN
ncbi:WhiB family transcriptional regulator [Streptomyces sp. NPDC002133]|uniref:WhiB family transcriptional regulator n=1 Tax=Streptomyces sp. NPDC002133 TaxID=3154409 RepID=UPI0033331749